MQEHTVEYRYLEDTYENGGIQVTIVYGMNQVGKSFLFKKFALFHEGIFFSSKPGSAKAIRRCFANHVGLEEKNEGEVPSYEEIFSFVFQNRDKKNILIIDDFQNVIRNDETFFPTLNKYVDENLNNCLIYLVSSHIGWVENQMISKIGRYANSITGFLKMHEMSFEECCSYFHNYATYDSLIIYAVFGGQYGYLDCLDKGSSTVENICNQIISSHSYILVRMHEYIEEQLRETSVYYTILEALAKGNFKLNDIYHDTGFSRAKISVYLKCLMELEFVEKVFSLDTPGRINVQKGVYRIVNPIILFYFRFIYPNESNFVLKDKKDFYDIYVVDGLRRIVADRFSLVCRNMFINMNEMEDLPFFCTSVGEWVGKKGSIPIIARNDDEQYLVGFSNEFEEPFSLTSYEEKKILLNEAKINPEYTYLFSLFGYSLEMITYAEKNSTLILIDME